MSSVKWQPFCQSCYQCINGCQVATICSCISSFVSTCTMQYAGLIPGLRPAKERWHHLVTTSLIGWAQAWNQPWVDIALFFMPLQWRHNGRDGISNHQPHDCLRNCLLGRRSKKTSKLHVTGHCAGEFPTQMASNAENVSIWWRHHALVSPKLLLFS